MELLLENVITACILIAIYNYERFSGKHAHDLSKRNKTNPGGIQGGCITSYSGWFFLLALNWENDFKILGEDDDRRQANQTQTDYIKADFSYGYYRAGALNNA